MKLKELKPLIYSYTGHIQLVIVYDLEKRCDLEHGCSAEYAYEHYGDMEIKRICSWAEETQDYIVLEV